MACLDQETAAPKAVSFDLFKNDGFVKGRAPPKALLARLNHTVPPNVQELRAQREATREERAPDDEVPVPSSTRKRTNRTVTVNSPTKSKESLPEVESTPPTESNASPKKDREPVAIGVGIGIEDQPQAPIGPPAELTEEQKQASLKLIAVFGEETVRGLHSQKWIHRMDSIKEVSSSMDTYKSSKRSVKMKMLEVFIQVASLLLFDSVLQVYLQCLDFLKTIVGDFASDVNPEVLREHIAPLIRVLLQRTGDMNSRICSAAVDFLMYLAALPLVGISHISEYLTEPIENALAFKHVIARLNLLLTVIGQYGFADDGGLSPERVMAIVVDALNGTNPKVRKQAALIVVEAYKRLGKKTEQYLRSCKPATLKFLKTEIEVELCDIEALADADVKTQEQEDLVLLEAFEPEEQRKMQPLVDVFGPGIQCLFSKKWKLRENALDRLRQQLELGTFNALEALSNSGKNSFGSKKSFMHCCRVLMIGLSDPVPIVYTMSCAALRSAIAAYAELISENDFRLGMENIITLLIGRSGDLNTSVKNVTVETLQAVASQEKVGVGFVGTYMLTPVENLNQWRMVVARLELLEGFVQQFGFSPGGLSTEATMTFAVGTFQSANGKVRKAAVNLIVEVYKQAGNVVQTYLKNQKPALVNELKSKIVKIARKDRTKSAPIQRLANMVQPLGTDSEDRLDSGKPRRPKTFPDTIGGLDETDTMTVRERVETWKKEKEQLQRPVEYKEDGHVVVGQEKGRSKVSDANQIAARNMESLPGPGMKLSDDIVHGRPKKAIIRGRMVFE